MTGVRVFGLIWFSQLVSLVGSSLSAFVLGVWVYQRTGQVTDFALIALCATLPAILIAPVAGVFTDRFHRRWLLLCADAGAATGTVALAVLYSSGDLRVWHIYVATAVTGAFGTVHLIASTALIPALVPAEHLSRANGLAQIAQAAQIAAPALAGALIGLVGVAGVLVIDLGSFAVASLVMLFVPLPDEATRPGGGRKPGTFWVEAAAGWRYLRGRSELTALIGVLGAFNLVFALAGVLVQPLILSFSSPAVLGVLMVLGGSGLFVGGLVMGVWGGPRRRRAGLAGALALAGVALALHAGPPSAVLIGIVAPLFLFTLPMLSTMVITALQTGVDASVMGRVLATARMVSQSATPIAYLAAGPLADRVLEPALAPGGALAGSLGAVVGTGPGRGIAVVFVIGGVALLALAAVVRVSRPLAPLDTTPAPAHAGADPSSQE